MADDPAGHPNAAIDIDDGIITVTLDRPDKLNAISHEMTASLWEAVLALGDRDDLRCMVITAKGRYFTAGQDISQREIARATPKPWISTRGGISGGTTAATTCFTTRWRQWRSR